jgi:hypothetical protein
VRLLVLLLSLGLAHPVAAQQAPKKKKQHQVTHKKPTPEQIRRFNELAKKRQKKG